MKECAKSNNPKDKYKETVELMQRLRKIQESQIAERNPSRWWRQTSRQKLKATAA
jgi:hypothetical protein